MSSLAPAPPAPAEATELAVLRQVLRDAPSGLAALVGPDHRIAYCNARFQAGTGGRAQVGQRLARCIPELAAQGFVALLDDVFRTGTPHFDHEARLDVLDPVTHQTETRFYDLALQPARDAHGRVQGVTVFSFNVTAQVLARHAAEQAQAAQQDFYETLLRELPTDVVAFDAEHRYRWANSVLNRQAELPAELLGATNAAACAARGYPPEVSAVREARFAEAHRDRAEVAWEEIVPGPAGTRHWLRRMRPVFHPDGSLRLMVASGEDVTARRRAEIELVQQQVLLRRVVDTVPHPIYVTNGRSQVTFANAAQEAISQALEYGRRRYREDPAAVPEFQWFQALEGAVHESQHEAGGEVAISLDSGEVRELQVMMRPLPQPGGGTHVLTVCTDVTDLKRTQRVATQAAQAQENFLATMSHEIRTPLSGVLGMAALLAKTTLGPEQRHYLDALQQAGAHLLRLLNDVLDMAKINAGPLELEQRPFDLCASMSAAVAPLALQATAKG